jgi:acyl carrier protein
MHCPFCENALAPGTSFCPHCGTSLAQPSPTGAGPGSPFPPPKGGPPPFAPLTPPTSSLAITSLVAGIIAWFVAPIVGAIVAVIAGHMARGEIRSRRGQLAGDGLAQVGLILGYLQLALAALVLVAFLAFFGWVATTVVQDRPRVVVRPQVVEKAPLPAAPRPGHGDDVEARVIEIVSEVFGVPAGQVSPALSLKNDLHADDLDLVELLMEITEEFDATFDERFDEVKTVGQLIELVKGQQKPARGEKDTRADPPGDDPRGQGRDRRTRSPRE